MRVLLIGDKFKGPFIDHFFPFNMREATVLEFINLRPTLFNVGFTKVLEFINLRPTLLNY